MVCILDKDGNGVMIPTDNAIHVARSGKQTIVTTTAHISSNYYIHDCAQSLEEIRNMIEADVAKTSPKAWLS